MVVGMRSPGSPVERPPRRLGPVLAWFGMGLLVWGIAAGLLLFSGYRAATRGRDGLEVLAGAEVLDVDPDEVERRLGEANGQLGRARARLESPVLWPLRPLPVIGRQLASARALARSGDQATEALVPLVREVQRVRADPATADRSRVLRSLATRLASVDAVLTDLDLGPDEALVAPLADARAEFAVQVTDLEEQVRSARLIADGLADFFEGSEYLLLGANNAEMRLASGMYLSVGELRVDGGEFDMSELEPAEDLAPVRGVPVLDQDLQDRWGFVTPSDDYRSLSYTARFSDAVAPQALAMWEAQRGRRLDGVVALDPMVLQALMRSTGPVTIDGATFDESSVLDYLLVEQYLAYEGDDLKTVRRDRLSELARAVLAQLGEGSWDPVQLLRDLEPLARGGHIRMWSPIEQQQAAWRELGVDGTLTGREVGVFLLNHGASKLDPFVNLAVDAGVSAREGGGSTLRLEITLRNETPAVLPPYTAGNWQDVGLPVAGAYLGRLAVYGPASTTAARIEPEAPFEVFGRDGPAVLMASRVELMPGETRRIVVELDLQEGGPEVLTLVPSARWPVVEWTWRGESFTDVEPRDLPLGG